MYKSLSSKDFKVPTARTRLGHIAWLRELMEVGVVHSVQWCDTRDMTADGHTKGSIDRELLVALMAGNQSYSHEVKTYAPFRSRTDSCLTKPAAGAGGGIGSARRNAPTAYFVTSNLHS